MALVLSCLRLHGDTRSIKETINILYLINTDAKFWKSIEFSAEKNYQMKLKCFVTVLLRSIDKVTVGFYGIKVFSNMQLFHLMSSSRLSYQERINSELHSITYCQLIGSCSFSPLSFPKIYKNLVKLYIVMLIFLNFISF